MTDSRSPFSFPQSEGKENIADLLRQLAEQSGHLAQQQANLIQAEVKASVNDLKLAAGAMAGAAIVGLGGFGLLLLGLAFLLGEVMEMWMATLIVAAVALAGAYLLFLSGRKKMQSSSLGVERTRRTIERAPAAIAGHSNGGPSDGR